MSGGSDNIKVIARFRPENENEKGTGDRIVEFSDEQTCSVSTKEFMGSFTFDRVFDIESAQKDVFDYSLKQTVDDLMKGYNGTVLAYGQTGSGKSYTMMGPNIDDHQTRGVIPRIVDRIFDLIQESPADIEYTVSVSYMEIYMERIKDLLNPKKDNLSIHEEKNRGVYVKGLTQEYVASADEVYEVMRQGTACRATGSTNMNQQSSRSHSIFAIGVSQKNISRGGSQKTGQLFLVDLAGSEKVGKTGASGQTLEEAKKINKSLSALGMVINSLTDGKSTHVPYRDSKLTRILQESLGGNSRTSLIVNCSPSSTNDQETLSTLRFGVRAKTIRNKAKINTELSPGELKVLLKKCQAQLDAKTAYANKLETELGMYRSSSQASSEISTVGSPVSSEFSSVASTIDGTTMRSSCSTPQSWVPSPNMDGEERKSWACFSDDEERDFKMDHMFTELKRLTDEKEELKLQLEQTKYSNQETEIKVKLLQDENDSLTGEMEASRQKLEQQDLLIRELQESSNVTNNGTGSNDHSINEALMILSSLSNSDKVNISRLREILEGIKHQQDTTRRVSEILQRQNDEFKSMVPRKNDNDNDNANDMITAMYEAKLQTLQNTITEMGQKFDRLTEENTTLQHKLKTTTSTDITEFERVKQSLMSDLQDRCEKIVELEISLDKAREQYNLALKNTSQQKRVALLQRNLEQLTVVQRQLVEQNTALKKEVVMSQKFLESRNDRIKHLEQSLLESQQALSRESENFEAKLGLLRNRLMEVRRRDPTEDTSDDEASHRLSSRIVKPLRGGGGGGGGGAKLWDRINKTMIAN
ncbi:hypothetical protein TRICI_001629 [Trichomonascus ciferrii]|uniref:Kinesin-like protein n=1 Tax=Trichomonascus ciferrii TaxID=44093 RepID=A0A642V812_9ASCO|nr:hypothetical protein TRICI_001629 [Trichomonascus ciferrii]